MVADSSFRSLALAATPSTNSPLAGARSYPDGPPDLRSHERQPLDLARGPDPFDSTQGHPEPARGVADPEPVEWEPVEPVERMSRFDKLKAPSLSRGLSNGRVAPMSPAQPDIALQNL